MQHSRFYKKLPDGIRLIRPGAGGQRTYGKRTEQKRHWLGGEA